MTKDIVIVIGFIFAVIIICKIWSIYGIKQYKKAKKCKSGLKYGLYIDKDVELKIVGTGNDGNGDYKISEAIKNIKMPSDVRIKVR